MGREGGTKKGGEREEWEEKPRVAQRSDVARESSGFPFSSFYLSL